MTIASEITRLQGAKTDIKASIEGKGVSVPSNAKLDTYDTYIDQISTSSISDIFMPNSFTLANWIHNSKGTPSIRGQLGDAAKPDNSAYYCYFWIRDDDTTAYSKFRLCVRVKTPGADPTTTWTDRIVDDITYFRPAGWRMKKVGNDVIFSALYYHGTTRYSDSKDEYFCVNATNNTFSSPVNLGIINDIGDVVYTNWTNSCGITAEESISAINKVSLSMPYEGSDYRALTATLNN